MEKIELTDPRYPVRLRQIHDPPPVLYIRGSVEALAHALPIGFVGTRKMTNYGRAVAHSFSMAAAKSGIAVVSGLAMGIDAICHQAVIEAGGTTVAVLGGGTDPISVGPRINAGLAERIVKGGGVLVSEHPPGTTGLPHHFPLRNRIIAGISAGVVVIEAPMKSGALITAFSALDNDRDVFAVPGPVTSTSSVGPNQLIARGAIPLLSPDDLARYYGIAPSLISRSSAEPGAGGSQAPHSRAILELLGANPATVDDLAVLARLGPAETLAALTLLELDGFIERTADGFMRR